MTVTPEWIGAFFFIFGTIVGSFLNVCIVRLPKEESIVFPASHCVKCKKPISWYDNIPLVSFLLLRGRCRACHASFSPRYFLVELLTGITFVLFYLYYDLDMLLLPYLVMVCGYLVATFVDFEHRIIPDEVSVGGMCVGVLFSALIPAMHMGNPEALTAGRWIMWILIPLVFAAAYVLHKVRPLPNVEEEVDHSHFEQILFGLLIADLIINIGFFRLGYSPAFLKSLDTGIVGALVGAGIIFGMGLLGDALFKKESLGGGDVKLMAMMGAFLGWEKTILAFFIAPFFGAFYGIFEMWRTKNSAIAYGPFLVLGALIAQFKGDQIISWILSGYGIF